MNKELRMKKMRFLVAVILLILLSEVVDISAVEYFLYAIGMLEVFFLDLIDFNSKALKKGIVK